MHATKPWPLESLSVCQHMEPILSTLHLPPRPSFPLSADLITFSILSLTSHRCRLQPLLDAWEHRPCIWIGTLWLGGLLSLSSQDVKRMGAQGRPVSRTLFSSYMVQFDMGPNDTNTDTDTDTHAAAAAAARGSQVVAGAEAFRGKAGAAPAPRPGTTFSRGPSWQRGEEKRVSTSGVSLITFWRLFEMRREGGGARGGEGGGGDGRRLTREYNHRLGWARAIGRHGRCPFIESSSGGETWPTGVRAWERDGVPCLPS